jgi:hypothetical protein
MTLTLVFMMAGAWKIIGTKAWIRHIPHSFRRVSDIGAFLSHGGKSDMAVQHLQTWPSLVSLYYLTDEDSTCFFSAVCSVHRCAKQR